MEKYDNPEELQGALKEAFDEYIEDGYSEEEALGEINTAEAAKDELKKRESSRSSSQDEDLQKKKKRGPGDPGTLSYPSMD